ncbi:MAG: carotenoid oxygenase family protein [Deltaproteobacteria bacterium]|nr:carotenoid oxygenase family protein [Deltaproteobacteria bacterium]
MSDHNPEGVLAPLHDESDFSSELEIIGDVPRGLRGSYWRNGPNAAFPPKGKSHLWDGDGMLHTITFDDDGVRYRNRWIDTAGLRAEREHGHALFGGMLEMSPPPPAVAEKIGPVKNAANTSIIRHAGRYLALWEAGLPTVVTSDLGTVGIDDFSGALKGSMTAHPKIDPITNEMLFFGYSPVPPYLRYHIVDDAGKLTRSLEIELPRGVMMHDFAITREHVIFFDSPAAFDFDQLAQGGSMIRWAPEHGTRIGVLPRDGSADDMRWIEIENCYVFHFLNAWTEGNQIVVMGASVDWMAVDYEHQRPPEGVDANSYLYRFTIDLSDSTCKKERIGDLAGEFCKVPDAVTGLKHRYGYLASFSTGVCDGAFFDSITQYDLVKGTETTRPFGTHKVVGEPAFAPNLQGRGKNADQDEDDGWIVTWVHERDGSASEFVVLDAKSIQAEPVLRVKMPRRVPLGFHGNWITP